MRLSSLVLAAAAGIAMGAFATQAGAMNNTSAAGLRAALGPIDAVESVHCRDYRHGHRFGHHWGRGCHVGEVEVAPRRGRVTIEERSRRSGSHVDVNVHDRKVRGETSVRSREQTNVRSTNTNSTSERSSTRTGSTGSNSRSSTTNREHSGDTKQNPSGPSR